LQITLITRNDEFAALSDRWSDLLTSAADANVFLSHEWLYTWWTAYRPSGKLRIVLAEEDGVLLGIAPMTIDRVWGRGLPVRVLRFIGDGSWETDHMSFVLHRDARRRAADALLEAIDRLEWDAAYFNQVRAAAATTAQILEYAERKSWRIHVDRTPCPIRRMPATFDALLGSLPARFRTSVRSSRRKLQASYRVEFGLHRDPTEFDAALDALFRNHASRWRAKGQAGVFVDARKRDLYTRITALLHRRGWLRFFYLKLDGRIVAQEYCFAVDGTVMLLQEGFDHAHAQENVGNTLRGFVFEHLIASGAEAYDFLAGASRHKSSWSDSAPDDLRIEIARPGLRGWLYAALPKAARRARDAVRARMGRRGNSTTAAE
jgi:CelD/BcsL family acetyltransferase involved in cellulose biosynthesis